MIDEMAICLKALDFQGLFRIKKYLSFLWL